MVARAGWQLIQPVARPQTSFRAPLEYMVGRELHCRVYTEPPNGFGGEHPRGIRLYPKQIPFAETRNCIDNENRGATKAPKTTNAAGSWRVKRRKNPNATSNKYPFPCLLAVMLH